MKTPEQYRVRTGIFATDLESYGCNGIFSISHYKIAGYSFTCLISDGSGWQHVSVSLTATHRNVDRCPTWEEMCYIKSLFWDDDEVVIQFHPAKSDYVNCHPYCLHLWKPDFITIPVPDPMLVGGGPVIPSKP